MLNKLIPIRLSHVLGQSGVGAIVRGANGLVVVQDTRQWTNRQGDPAGQIILYVERGCQALGISQKLYTPPVAKELANGQIDGVCVPATRFPSWMRCPHCGMLYQRPWNNAQADDTPCCIRTECESKPRLEQVTWVLVHPAGYLADVPWHFLVHREARDPFQRNCKIYDQLRLHGQRNKSRVLSCNACRAETQFRGDEPLAFGQKRVQPWTRNDIAPPSETAQNDQSLAQVLAVNDIRIYTPVAKSFLVIPPESRIRKGTVVDRLYRTSGDRAKLDAARTLLMQKSAMRTLAAKYGCTPQEIEVASADLKSGYPLYGENLTPGQLRESEFKAFLEVLPDQRDDEDLVTRNKSNEWHVLGNSIDLSAELKIIVRSVRHLVRVDRLKAVRVFMGFTRLGGETVPPDIVGQSNWLPAIELYGEGIFVALDEARLGKWEQNLGIQDRLEGLQRRFALSAHKEPNPLTARFMLLHTLSHLLMRQIESEGGYPAASIIERIYCSSAPDPMAGILIHVAVPDIAGSLGGLAELAEPRRFLGVLSRALEHACWCSFDPVCGEHKGQGPELLNLAACHACALVPEPACEYGNALLDRSFVKNNDCEKLLSFFGAF